jgi:hypothetical protein
VLLQVVESFTKEKGGDKAQAVEAIETMHANDLSKKALGYFKEPITKILDEINYP